LRSVWAEAGVLPATGTISTTTSKEVAPRNHGATFFKKLREPYEAPFERDLVDTLNTIDGENPWRFVHSACAEGTDFFESIDRARALEGRERLLALFGFTRELNSLEIRTLVKQAVMGLFWHRQCEAFKPATGKTVAHWNIPPDLQGKPDSKKATRSRESADWYRFYIYVVPTDEREAISLQYFVKTVSRYRTYGHRLQSLWTNTSPGTVLYLVPKLPITTVQNGYTQKLCPEFYKWANEPGGLVESKGRKFDDTMKRIMRVLGKLIVQKVLKLAVKELSPEDREFLRNKDNDGEKKVKKKVGKRTMRPSANMVQPRKKARTEKAAEEEGED
jgi:hypothetical protein